MEATSKNEVAMNAAQECTKDGETIEMLSVAANYIHCPGLAETERHNFTIGPLPTSKTVRKTVIVNLGFYVSNTRTVVSPLSCFAY